MGVWEYGSSGVVRGYINLFPVLHHSITPKGTLKRGKRLRVNIEEQ